MKTARNIALVRDDLKIKFGRMVFMIYLAQTIIMMTGVASKLANREEVNKTRKEKLDNYMKKDDYNKQQETMKMFNENMCR